MPTSLGFTSTAGFPTGSRMTTSKQPYSRFWKGITGRNKKPSKPFAAITSSTAVTVPPPKGMKKEAWKVTWGMPNATFSRPFPG